jgi:hypothetical protein
MSRKQYSIPEEKLQEPISVTAEEKEGTLVHIVNVETSFKSRQKKGSSLANTSG